MALHHRPEVADMRFAFDHGPASHQHQRSGSGSGSDSDRSSSSRNPSSSSRSYDTQPTEYSVRTPRTKPQVHYPQRDGTGERERRREVGSFFEDRATQESPRNSTPSIVESDNPEPEEIPQPQIANPRELSYESREPPPIPATPHQFSNLFPSHRRMLVRHDDSTLDGNMNLRVDVEVQLHGRKRDMTLFHLRMHDLGKRDFSLRRYCRDSGREVCHSALKQTKSSLSKQASFRRSLSSVLSSMKPKHAEPRTPPLTVGGGLKRFDSGYGSLHSSDFDEDLSSKLASHERAQPEPLTSVIRLEFSNYAQVDVRRAGSKGSRRYEFEYWGVAYAWRRRRDAQLHEVSFLLTRLDSNIPLGFIRPSPLSCDEAREEDRVGGWIPPCSLWIEDETIVRAQKDVSDVVVACGLMALVDDCIRARFPSEASRGHGFQLMRSHSGLEHMNPRKLISGLFHRSSSGSWNDRRPASSGRSDSSRRPSIGADASIKPRTRGETS